MCSTQQKKTTAVIVDDEALARAYLKELLANYAEIEILQECTNGFQAVSAVVEHKPDLLFLDIEMPKLDGFEVLEALGDDSPKVIFITAYDEYALRAFEVHAADYLLKPFSKERLDKTLKRILEGERSNISEIGQLAIEAMPERNSEKRVVIRDGKTVTVAAWKDIFCVTAEGDYVSVHLKDKNLLKLETISAMSEIMEKGNFVRIHRGSIINIDYLDEILTTDKDTKQARLKNGTCLPISRNGYKALLSRLEMAKR